MAKEEKRGGNRSYVMQAEIALADYVATLPELSALLGGKSVPVFAISAENAAAVIKQRITGALKQCVEVAFVRTNGAAVYKQANVHGMFADCVFRFSVNSKLILGENAERTTLSIASVIIDALLMKRLAFPFDSTTAVRFGGLSRVVEDDGTFSTVLELTARVCIL